MTEARSSYASMLRSTSIIGGATVISLAIGLVRMKAFALLVGPAGVGLLGVLSLLWTTGTALAGLNLGVSGIRQIGLHPENSEARSKAESAVWYLALLTGLIGGACLWIFERFYTNNADPLPTIPWIALAVTIAVVHSAQLVFLQVYGRTADIARIRIYGTTVGSILGIAAVAYYGIAGLYIAVFVMPLASLLVSIPYFRQLPRLPWRRPDRSLLDEWRALLILGTGVSMAAWIGSIGQLALRWVLVDQSGLAATGIVQAAFTLTNTNLSIILAAMAMEYYPKLSFVADDIRQLRQILNDQLSLAIALACPVIIVAIAIGPWLLPLLYSKEFYPAIPLFQWQVAADVLKLTSWALGYVLIVTRSVTGYVLAELVFDTLLVGISWLLYDTIGLDSIAVAYALGLAGSVLVSIKFAKRRGIVISPSNYHAMWTVAVVAMIVCVLSQQSSLLGLAVGSVAALLFAMRGLKTIRTNDAAIAARLDGLLFKISGRARR